MHTTRIPPSAQEVLFVVEQRGEDGVLSPSAWGDIPGLQEHFPDDDRLLATLQQRWLHTLAAEVEHALETGAGELHADVRSAYRRAAARRRGLRRILDAHDGHPAVAAGLRREHELLCGAAGVRDAGQLVCRADDVVLPVRRPGRVDRLAHLLRRVCLPAAEDVQLDRAQVDGSLPV
jgi:hypothetical protein